MCWLLALPSCSIRFTQRISSRSRVQQIMHSTNNKLKSCKSIAQTKSRLTQLISRLRSRTLPAVQAPKTIRPSTGCSHWPSRTSSFISWTSLITRTFARAIYLKTNRIAILQFSTYFPRYWSTSSLISRRVSLLPWMTSSDTRPPTSKTSLSISVMRTGRSLSSTMRRSIRFCALKWARNW